MQEEIPIPKQNYEISEKPIKDSFFKRNKWAKWIIGLIALIVIAYVLDMFGFAQFVNRIV